MFTMAAFICLKYSQKSNILKYYYNFKYLLSISVFYKIA